MDGFAIHYIAIMLLSHPPKRRGAMSIVSIWEIRGFKVTGFEPMALCSQNRYATKLRYTLKKTHAYHPIGDTRNVPHCLETRRMCPIGDTGKTLLALGCKACKILWIEEGWEKDSLWAKQENCCTNCMTDF